MTPPRLGTVVEHIVAERVLTSDGVQGASRIVVDEHGIIVAVEPARGGHHADSAGLVAPGFVDLQVNGIDDVDVSTAESSDWDRLDALLLAQGTTTWCPTLVTRPLPEYEAPLERIASAAARESTRPRPHLAGAHLEGPFLGGASGAHQRDLVIPVDLDWLATLPDVVRLVTLGPEQDQAPAAVRLLTGRGVIVSLGHSVATGEQFAAAVEAGATMVTHLYNAMGGLHHREPGLAAFALTEHRVALGLIADGVHVHPTMIHLAFQVAPGRVVLVTDAVAHRSGTLGLAGMSVRDGAPRLADGTLAGSALTMDAAVRCCVQRAGVPLEAALRAAASVPASLLGLHDRGVIAPGRRADLVRLDDDLAVREVWVGGVRATGVA